MILTRLLKGHSAMHDVAIQKQNPGSRVPHFFPFFFLVLPFAPTAGPPPSTMTASSSLPPFSPGVVGFATAAPPSSSFIKSDSILARLLSHQSLSTLACACTSSIRLRMMAWFIISLALWKILWPQLGAKALAFAVSPSVIVPLTSRPCLRSVTGPSVRPSGRGADG